MCCLQGQVRLTELKHPPIELWNLFSGSHQLSAQFKKDIRQYNAAFAFTSLGAKIDTSVLNANRHGGPYTFRINGELHHRTGSLLPDDGNAPTYAQIYINDEVAQRNARMGRNPNLEPELIAELQAMILRDHPYISIYRQALQRIQDTPLDQQQNVYMVIRSKDVEDRRRYNEVVDQNEIGVLIPGDGTQETSNHRDIVLHRQGGALQRISHLHKSYSCLHYVLLFPTGENGFFPSIPSYPGPSGKFRSDCVSERCYYAYRLHVRYKAQLRDQPALFMGSKLLQQFTVDAWASIQQNTLNWARYNQKKI